MRANDGRRTPPLHLVERGPGVEARRLGRCLPPTPRLYAPTDGDWQMQDLPGAPGTARQGRTRIIVSTNDGGVATQPRAPGHERPLAAPRAARHGRLSAASRAPGADVPPATTAGAPGQHRLRAMANATVALPAGLRRLRQEGLPRVPANPRTLTYPRSHRDTAHTRTKYSRAFPSPCAAGGLQGGQVVSLRLVTAAKAAIPSPARCPSPRRLPFPAREGAGG